MPVPSHLPLTAVLSNLPPEIAPDGARAPTGADPVTTPPSTANGVAAEGGGLPPLALPPVANDDDGVQVPRLLRGRPPEKLLRHLLNGLRQVQEETHGENQPGPPDLALEEKIAGLLKLAEKTLRTSPALLEKFKAAVDTPYSYWQVATSP